MQEIIDIIIRDKIDASISRNLASIGTAASAAGDKVIGLSSSLSKISSAGLDASARAAQQAAAAIQKAAAAATQAATAATMSTNANNAAALAAQRLATEQQRTAAAMARSEAAASAAALAELRLAAAQQKASDSALKKANAATAAATAAARQGQAADGAAGSTDRHTNALNRGAGGLSLWQKAASAAAAALSVKEVIGMADAYTTLQNKLQNVATSQVQVNELTERLFELANDTRSSVEATATSFARFDRALKHMGKSQEDSLRMTETINKALVVSGATASESSSALLQLSQAFNAGKLSGDEFRSVSENMPAVLDAVAKVLGKPIGQVKELAAEGKITAKVMFDAFKSMETSIDSTFNKTIPTTSQALTVLRNNAIKFFGELDKSTGFTRALSAAIITVSKNLDILAVAAATVGAALLVAFGPAIIAAIGSAASAALAFTVALAANPIGLAVIAVTALAAAFFAFGDSTKAGTEGMATLADVGTAAFDSLKDTMSGVIDYWGDFFKSGDNALKGVSKSSDNATYGMNKGFTAMFDNGYTGWAKFAMAGALAMDGIAGAALTMSRATMNYLDMLWDRMSGLGAAMKEIMNGPAAMIDAYNQRVDAGKFKSIADAYKNAFESSLNTVNTRGFSSKLDVMFQRADQLAAQRDAAQKKKASALRGAGEDVTGGTADTKAAKAAENRAKALAQVNLELDNEIARLGMLAPLREQQAKFDQIVEKLAGKNIKLSADEEVVLRSKIKTIQDGVKVQAEMDRMYQEAVGPLESYNNAMKAANMLINQGAISREQYNRQILKASETYKNAMDPMRQEMQALRDQSTLLTYLPKQRAIEAQVMELVNAKRREGIELTTTQIQLYRAELTALQQKNAVDAEQNALLANSVDARQKYIDQLTAIQQLNANPASGFTPGDSANAVSGMLGGMGIDTSAMQVQMDANLAMHQTQYDQLEAMRAADLIKEQDYAAAKAQIQEKEFRTRNQLAQNFFTGLATLQSSSVKELAMIGKTAAITEALVNTYVGVTKAWAQGGIYGAAMAGVVLAQGMAQVAAIRSTGYAQGGYTGDMPRTAEAGVVHGQEFVMNANATSRLGTEDLYALQNGTASIQRNNAGAGTSSGEAVASRSGDGGPTVVSAPPVNLKVVNTLDPAMMGDYLATPEGEQVLINTIRRNGDSVKSAIGV